MGGAFVGAALVLRITVGVGACEYPGGVVTVLAALTVGASALEVVAALAVLACPGPLAAGTAAVTVLCLAPLDVAAVELVEAVASGGEIGRAAATAVAVRGVLAAGAAATLGFVFLEGFGGAAPGCSSTCLEMADHEEAEAVAEVEVEAEADVAAAAGVCVVAPGLSW